MPKKEEESVNVLDSLDGKIQSEENPDGEGESQRSKEIEKKVRENLRAEYERKKNEEVEKLKENLVGEYEARIKELENKAGLTPREEKELRTLEDKVAEIERNPDAKPWDAYTRKVFREEFLRMQSEDFDRRHKEDRPHAEEWVREKAKELKVDQKDLEEELLVLMEDKWLGDLPTVRVQKAFNLLEKLKSKYSAKLEEKNPEHSEHGGREQRKVTVKEAFSEASKNGKWDTILKQVAENQKEGQSSA